MQIKQPKSPPIAPNAALNTGIFSVTITTELLRRISDEAAFWERLEQVEEQNFEGEHEDA